MQAFEPNIEIKITQMKHNVILNVTIIGFTMLSRIQTGSTVGLK